jgi:hypothetical protein
MRIHLILLTLALAIAAQAPARANIVDKWMVMKRIRDAKAQMPPKLTSGALAEVRRLTLMRIPGSTELAVAKDGQQIGVYQPVGDIYRPLTEDGTPGDPAPRPWGRLRPKVGRAGDLVSPGVIEESSDESLPLVLGLVGTVCCLGLGILVTRSR